MFANVFATLNKMLSAFVAEISFDGEKDCSIDPDMIK